VFIVPVKLLHACVRVCMCAYTELQLSSGTSYGIIFCRIFDPIGLRH
jgi:hypothetical protein